MAELVSPCCGAEYTDYDGKDSSCCGAKVNNICLGEDCPEYREPAERYICEECDEPFKETETKYEYHQKGKEAKYEMEADECRDMGEFSYHKYNE